MWHRAGRRGRTGEPSLGLGPQPLAPLMVLQEDLLFGGEAVVVTCGAKTPAVDDAPAPGPVHPPVTRAMFLVVLPSMTIGPWSNYTKATYFSLNRPTNCSFSGQPRLDERGRDDAKGACMQDVWTTSLAHCIA